jgi:hypothetical protein
MPHPASLSAFHSGPVVVLEFGSGSENYLKTVENERKEGFEMSWRDLLTSPNSVPSETQEKLDLLCELLPPCEGTGNIKGWLESLKKEELINHKEFFKIQLDLSTHV